ncbi:hypothetical protein [Kitasatospora sp. NPDC057500]|uniref:hypothetical protein n=1 Tax=Kitasatospora sp. NPDC057500 TaxID=3346151 RepID=UPI003689CDED
MMVQELLTASGAGRRGAARLVPDGRLSETTIRRWCRGEQAPASPDVFWELVERLEDLRGPLPHTRPALASALAAAQAEADRGRRLQNAGRDERTIIDAFVNDEEPSAPSYLWWHAELPAGKTALLTSFAEGPPEGTDVLFCGISGRRGTDTRAGFVAALHEQARVPRRRRRGTTEEEFERLLAKAAADSRRRRRQLVLVIDDLDADLAWPVTDADRAATESIAALLPAEPPKDLRIIVSTRRSTPVPADLPAHHPLRLRRCLRLLTPGRRNAEVEQAGRADLERLRAVDLGRAVTDLLAITGGGLRMTDLAHLAGASDEEVSHLLSGREYRCVVQDDTLTRTFRLSHAGMPESIRKQLDGAATEHYRDRLHTWAAQWAAAGWPADTPPYLLANQPRLWDGTDRLGPLLLDPRWQLRAADAFGPELPLQQLHDFAFECPDGLGPAVRLAAAQDFLRRRVNRVPPRAPVLFALLGDLPRGLAIARSEPEPVLRAARLAAVAVEAARMWHPDAAGIVVEAAGLVLRAGHFTPAAGSLEDGYDELAEAARTLAELGRKPEARTLYRAVALSGATDIEALARAAALLSDTDGTDHLAQLEEHAERLGTLGPRSQAVAVDIWATIAAVSASRGVANADRIRDLCRGLTTAEGLPVVDVLALAASALVSSTGRTKQAQDVLTMARACLSAALRSTSPEDRAHRGRGFSGTMERFVRAEVAAGFGRAPHLEAQKLVLELSAVVRTGVLGDDLLERARTYLASVAERLAAEDAAAAAARREEKLAARRARDAEARRFADERAAHRRSAAARPGHRPPESPVAKESRPTDTAHRKPAKAGGGGEQQSAPYCPVTPLQDAEHLVRSGNPELGRERLEQVLRSSHPRTPTLISGRWARELVRALGTVGGFEQAERLVLAAPEPDGQARRFAALSVGCSLGGHRTAATANALAASRLVGRTARFAVKTAVAQALAHAGDADGAAEMAGRAEPESAGPSTLRTHRAMAVVAAGLVHSAPPPHDPEPSRSAVEPWRGLIGHLSNPLPLVAPLLLASPEPRRPTPELGELLDLAAGFVHRARQTWDPESALILAVLRRLGLSCAPDRPADELDVWLRALRPERLPRAGLALLSALDGDLAEVHRLAEAAPSPAARADVLATAAHALSAAPAPLLTEEEPVDGALRLCLALVHACTVRPTCANAPRAAASTLVHDLLTGGEWTRAIPLLPVLAPEALPALGDLAVAHLDRLRSG